MVRMVLSRLKNLAAIPPFWGGEGHEILHRWSTESGISHKKLDKNFAQYSSVPNMLEEKLSNFGQIAISVKSSKSDETI